MLSQCLNYWVFCGLYNINMIFGLCVERRVLVHKFIYFCVCVFIVCMFLCVSAAEVVLLLLGYIYICILECV